MTVLIILPVLGIIMLYLGLLKSGRSLLPVAITGLLAASVSLVFEWGPARHLFSDMLIIDHYSVAFSFSMTVITVIILLLAGQYYRGVEFHVAEIYALMLFSLTGAILMVSFSNLAMLFIGIETLSLPMYVLAGSKKFSVISNEASFKYYLLGSFASAVFLLGIALVYGTTATFNVQGIAEFVNSRNGVVSPLFLAGLILILIGMAFKVAAIPFHFWTPDVYEGSPTLITLFMATVVKTAGFAAFLKLFSGCFSQLTGFWQPTLWGITALTLIISNLVATRQNGIKRMMAYSAISHSGFLLLAIISLNSMSAGSMLFYTFSYSLASIAIFGVLIIVKNARGDEGTVDSFNGLNHSDHFLSLVMAVALMSLAGIPLTAGFFAKYFLFVGAIKEHFTWLVIIAIIGALIAIYYYFRILTAIYFHDGDQPELKTGIAYKTAFVICLIGLVVLGIFPGLGISIL